VFYQRNWSLICCALSRQFCERIYLVSIEFVCKVSGSKLILVMGHEQCGGIKAAVDDDKLRNITPMLQKIITTLVIKQNIYGEI
jgi:carbonic anhydrase